MSNLDADAIRRSIGAATTARLAEFEIFHEIESTNSYLMQQPGLEPGFMRIALTDNQTAGRGRHGRTWQSPPGSGLCLSAAYTFAASPENLPALTLAIGLAVIAALKELDVADVHLKWPNDLIAMDGKLGGILTEAQTQASGAVTVVTGIGLNVDLSERPDLGADAVGALPISDLRRHTSAMPELSEVAASMIRNLHHAFVEYESSGFSPFVPRWSMHDWLFGREVIVETPQQRVTGVGAGVAEDGALLVDTPADGTRRITSGSVFVVGIGDDIS